MNTRHLLHCRPRVGLGAFSVSPWTTKFSRGLEDQIPSTKKPALLSKTGFYMVAVQKYEENVLKK
eukprot:SAG11_NODE_158_length_14064_cov_6.063860_6_plen_65_part_00